MKSIATAIAYLYIAFFEKVFKGASPVKIAFAIGFPIASALKLTGAADLYTFAELNASQLVIIATVVVGCYSLCKKEKRENKKFATSKK